MTLRLSVVLKRTTRVSNAVLSPAAALPRQTPASDVRVWMATSAPAGTVMVRHVVLRLVSMTRTASLYIYIYIYIYIYLGV